MSERARTTSTPPPTTTTTASAVAGARSVRRLDSLSIPEELDTVIVRNENNNDNNNDDDEWPMIELGYLSVGFAPINDDNHHPQASMAMVINRIQSVETLVLQNIPRWLKDPLLRLMCLPSLRSIEIYYDDAPFRNVLLDDFSDMMRNRSRGRRIGNNKEDGDGVPPSLSNTTNIQSFGFRHCHGLVLGPFAEVLDGNDDDDDNNNNDNNNRLSSTSSSSLTSFTLHDCALNDPDNDDDISMEDLGTLLRRHKTIRHVNTDDPELVQQLSPSETLETLTIEESSIGMISVLIEVVPNMTNLKQLQFGGRRDRNLKKHLMTSLRCCPKLESVECSGNSNQSLSSLSSSSGLQQVFFLDEKDKCRLNAWAERNRMVRQWLVGDSTTKKDRTCVTDDDDDDDDDDENARKNNQVMTSSLPKCLWPQFLEMIHGMTTENDILFQLLSTPFSPLLEHLLLLPTNNRNQHDDDQDGATLLSNNSSNVEEPNAKRSRTLS